ncbi:nucleotide disphospho-sugar-binding domain-containing protein [Nocardia brevicatena]|uniref:nucleotide disphospho-sugar-binding domain-containing protein n=1 Tax=Nocardia brevicatena TaxID=37327 RepID=UPI001FDF68F5|nr:glycosyltransferase [Nocardia brevicatena]
MPTAERPPPTWTPSPVFLRGLWRLIPRAILEQADAFVTHAGMGGCGEGLLAGVPVIAVPQATERFINADRLVELGMARRIDTRDAARDSTGGLERPRRRRRGRPPVGAVARRRTTRRWHHASRRPYRGQLGRVLSTAEGAVTAFASAALADP